MARFRICLAIGLALTAFLSAFLRGQDTDENKPEHHPSPARHGKAASPTPTASPKKKKHPTPKPSKTPPKPKSDDEEPAPEKSKKSAAKPNKSKHSVEADNEGESSGKPTPSARASKKPSTSKPRSSKKKKAAAKAHSSKTKSSDDNKAPQPEKTPKPSPAKPAASDAAPHAIAVPQPGEHPIPGPSASSTPDTAAQLTIEKSGFEESRGLEPTPSPPPRRSWFWPWSRSRASDQRYRFLTRSVIEEIRRAPVASNRWKFIVVHNSGTRQGNARVFDYYHKHVRRMKNGLAYHFVIGNGTSTRDGEIEIGDRWRRQINGGHVHSDFLNNIALGICLVGDFNRDQPTRAQLDSCEELIRYLRERCGKADGRAIPVRPHREMNPPRWATDCPGDAFPYSWFRRF
ncbi:MAG TPA: N-acetylmuramoyl-L-alanine amidase [Chthoniobacterales bacterium]